ncbi:MAG TPA: twin-arginine translocase subunit TatC [Limnochordia bacterium]|nr:twin-arginine translocase subunit TatC [Limnochordia bacterium]
MLEGLLAQAFRILAVVRRQLVAATVVTLITSIGGYIVAPAVLRQLVGPDRALSQLVFLSPAEAFMAQIKLGVGIGVIAALPFLFVFAWQGMRPFLPPRDRRMGWWLVPTAMILFGLGSGFAYFGMIPMAMRFLLSFESAGLQPMISVSSYVGFLIWMVVPSGVLFEMPLVVWALTRSGILTPQWLNAKRGYAILLIAIIAAVLTPADVFSMIVMALPMVAVFEASILVSRLAARRRRRRLARELSEA